MKSETNNALKHTPGPWKLGYSETFGHQVLIQTEYPCDSTRIILAQSHNEANARLIAAAPDLLEACKALLEEWKSRTAMIESCDLTEEEDRAVELAESAITKATGETL